jgi:hypothetical protein
MRFDIQLEIESWLRRYFHEHQIAHGDSPVLEKLDRGSGINPGSSHSGQAILGSQTICSSRRL